MLEKLLKGVKTVIKRVMTFFLKVGFKTLFVGLKSWGEEAQDGVRSVGGVK